MKQIRCVDGLHITHLIAVLELHTSPDFDKKYNQAILFRNHYPFLQTSWQILCTSVCLHSSFISKTNPHFLSSGGCCLPLTQVLHLNASERRWWWQRDSSLGQVSLFTFAKPLISCGVSDNEINKVKCYLSSIRLMSSSKSDITTVKTKARISRQNNWAANCHILLLEAQFDETIGSLFIQALTTQLVSQRKGKHQLHNAECIKYCRAPALIWMVGGPLPRFLPSYHCAEDTRRKSSQFTVDIWCSYLFPMLAS